MTTSRKPETAPHAMTQGGKFYIWGKRANGHLKSIIEMIETERPCVEVAQQLFAVEKAIIQAKKTLIQDHVDHCLEHAMEKKGKKSGALDEFKEITKYL